jgi:hypothetical protein
LLIPEILMMHTRAEIAPHRGRIAPVLAIGPAVAPASQRFPFSKYLRPAGSSA